MVNSIPNLHVTGAGSGGQFFPCYTYEQRADEVPLFGDDPEEGYARVDNITDAALADYRSTYDSDVSRDDIFYYVYALLRSPDYRAEFASDLRKMFPCIPKVATAQDFNAYVEIGRELATLHIGYESVEPYPLREVTRSRVDAAGGYFYRVQKMAFGKNGKTLDKSTIIYNSNVTPASIPIKAYEYMLGTWPAIE